jgi:GntR family transcriptional regulator/MocR family aminotransferase
LGSRSRTAGAELLGELSGIRRQVQLESRLRKFIRDGTLASETPLPSSRALASTLRVSRGLVVEAYTQLRAEGYIVTRHGAGTYVGVMRGGSPVAAPTSRPKTRLRFDFFPGRPDLASFPRELWLRALRNVLRGSAASALSYPDPRGTPELRGALAQYLNRARGLAVDPELIVIVAGATQGLALFGRALVRSGFGDIAVENPGLPSHRSVLAAVGLGVRGVTVDSDGLDVGELAGIGAVLCTPAHQWPTGVALSPARRAALIAWATGERLIVEDDYDAEFRYDRAPLAALQGLAPDHVVYVGSVSKTLAPGLRLGWLVLPPRWAAVATPELLNDFGSSTLGQLALAQLIETSAYDRHLRKARERNRSRHDALISAVAEHLPGARVSGISAGLHTLVRLPFACDPDSLTAAAASREVGVYPLSSFLIERPNATDALVLGYASLPESAIVEGIKRIGEALAAL